jgi:kinesin family protein 2/24
MNNNIIQNSKSKPPSRSHIRPSKSPSPDVANLRRQTKINTANPIISQSKKYSVHDEMEKMKQRREERKKRIEDEKRSKLEMLNNPDFIAKLDYEYERMITQKKKIIEQIQPEQHINSDNSKIFVCVRKRPIFQKEIQEGEIDCISAINPKVSVYDCKVKIDGITKYIDTNDFYFDNFFHESEDTETLYECSVKPAINLLLQGGVVTCFAYGQTGSGKTFTMKGIQDLAIDSLFDAFNNPKIKNNKFEFYVSFFEIYSGRLYDLLNNRNKVSALEDKNQKVQIFGLEEKQVQTAQQMKDIVDFANTMRTTHNTVTNETSSRSHAICNVSYILYTILM